MAFQKKHKGLTKRTSKLLDAGETATVDFKSKPEGLHVDDLVAFANTEQGGEILLGVVEKKRDDGSQYGEAFGCAIGDEIVLQILNKAISAIPPISIKLFAENTENNPIIRVSIPSSESRPHSTPKGIYSRRDGSRNRPLHPNELLAIFLESESRAFAERFEDTAESISKNLGDLEASLKTSINRMADQLGWTDSKLDDTEHALNQAAAHAKSAFDEASDISIRLRALFRQDEREDPVYQKVRAEFLNEIIEQLRNKPEIIETVGSEHGSISISTFRRTAKELSEDDLQEIFEEAYKEVTGEELRPKKQ